MDFDINLAKAGAPLFTGLGVPVTFIGHVPEARPDQRIVVLKQGYIETFSERGEYTLGSPGFMDLCMAPPKED